jgi:hypothetical protein
MYKRGIILSLLAIILVGNALCEMTKIPVSEDAYINLGTGNQQVYNQTDLLICSVNVTYMNGTKISSNYRDPVIQFDISGLNITNDDVAILALKAAPMDGQINDSALVALLSIGSEWDEESDYTMLLANLLPAWKIIKKNDLTGMSTNTDGDAIFAFDVSKKLLDATAKGDKMSFLLQAISNSSYEVNFLSKESGQGPYLMIMPYSANSISNITSVADQNISLSSNMSETNSSNMSEASIGEMKIPVTVSSQSETITNQNVSMNQTNSMNETENMNKTENISQSVEKRSLKGKNDI